MTRVLLLLLSLAGLLAAQPRVTFNPLTSRFEFNDKTVGGVPQDVTGTPADGYVPTYVSGTGRWVWAAPPGSAGGETNTASNVGSAGVGLYDSKSGADLRFRKINPASSALSVTLDALNSKIDIDFVALTASRLLVTNGSGYPAASSVTSTEAGYLSGVTSSIQTQLNGKAATSHNHSGSQITSGTIPVTVGGTGRTSWTASRCVQVASDGLSLEAAGVSCGGGDVGGGSGLTTAGAGVYVSSSSTLAQDTSWTRVAAGQYTLYNATGPNQLIVRVGSAQSSTNLLTFRDSSNAVLSFVDNLGQINTGAVIATGNQFAFGTTYISMRDTYGLRWSDGSSWSGSHDLGLIRLSANNLAITNGRSTNYWGLGSSGIQCLSGDGNNAGCDLGATGARVRNVNAAGTGTFGGSVSASETYLGGAAGTDGTWRLTVSGGSLLIQKRESGSYVTKQTIAP